MLRPWVPLIALGLALLLLWQLWRPGLVWGGGLLLAWALLGPALEKLRARRRKAQAEKKALELDWKIIDRSSAKDRPQADCERPETLGVCTGRECLLYDTCTFNIKKPLP